MDDCSCDVLSWLLVPASACFAKTRIQRHGFSSAFGQPESGDRDRCANSSRIGPRLLLRRLDQMQRDRLQIGIRTVVLAAIQVGGVERHNLSTDTWNPSDRGPVVQVGGLRTCLVAPDKVGVS